MISKEEEGAKEPTEIRKCILFLSFIFDIEWTMNSFLKSMISGMWP